MCECKVEDDDKRERVGEGGSDGGGRERGSGSKDGRASADLVHIYLPLPGVTICFVVVTL